MRFSFVSLILSAFVIVGLNGCSKLPTWAELTGGQKPVAEEPAAPPPPPKVEVPVVPKGPSPEEVIAKFKTLRPGEITDATINNLTNLEEGIDQIAEINADGSALTKNAFGAIEKFTNLHQLRLCGTRVDDDACQNIAKVSSLEVLALSNTTVSDVGVAAISGLVNLRRLELENCRLTRNAFAAIGQLPALEDILIRSTNLDAHGFELLCNCKTLKRMVLAENPLDDFGLDALKKLENLEELELSKTKVNGAGLIHAQKSAKTLKSLGLYNCNIGPMGGRAISHFKALERLNLGEIPLLDDLGLNNIVSGMKNLKYLNLSKSQVFNGQGLAGLKSCKELEELHIDQCPLIGDKPAVQIIKQLKSLKRLSLGGTAITPNGIAEIRANLPNLQL